MSEYEAFLDRKRQLGGSYGFDPSFVPDFLFDFQQALVTWAVRQGRAAIYADCGLGKTAMELAWAENVLRHEGKPVLLLTPLAVADQTVAEAAKFGIEATHSRDGSIKSGIVVANYERLHLFREEDFSGVVCDESSILKNFDGKRKTAITSFSRKMKFRLLATATAAPNDYTELGTSSEALGHLGYMDMLNRFFKNDMNTSDTKRKFSHQSGVERAKWRFKGHAERDFWRWVCSWARAIRRPSDLGFDDTRFVLPDLIEREHLVAPRKVRPGLLFDVPPNGLWEEREENRRTITERCERVAEIVIAEDGPSVAWCHLNDEGTMLEKLIPGSVQVSGSDSIEEKEEAFLGFSSGQFKKLIVKPKIGALGLNWQHCAHATFFPSHSFEQYYQAVRRCWRFGQTRPVRIDVVTTESGKGVHDNLKRKSLAADRMFTALVSHFNEALKIDRSREFTKKQEIPEWLSTTN